MTLQTFTANIITADAVLPADTPVMILSYGNLESGLFGGYLATYLLRFDAVYEYPAGLPDSAFENRRLTRHHTHEINADNTAVTITEVNDIAERTAAVAKTHNNLDVVIVKILMQEVDHNLTQLAQQYARSANSEAIILQRILFYNNLQMNEFTIDFHTEMYNRLGIGKHATPENAARIDAIAELIQGLFYTPQRTTGRMGASYTTHSFVADIVTPPSSNVIAEQYRRLAVVISYVKQADADGLTNATRWLTTDDDVIVSEVKEAVNAEFAGTFEVEVEAVRDEVTPEPEPEPESEQE